MSDYQYPLSTGRSNILGTEAFRDLLGQSLEEAKEEIIILSAYVKKVGVEWLIKKLKKKEIKCTIISRWDKSDIAQGSSDIECYELCKSNKWHFKILKDLHAKIMLIDKNELFIGSPNLTGHGMSLIPVSNKEMGVKLEATSSDINIVKNLNEEAILVDDQIYKELKLWKENLPEIKKIKYPDFPDSLKSKFTENLDKIWVHNFPWSNVEDLLSHAKITENISHDLDLFGLKNEEFDNEILKKQFEKSKVYNWLLKQLRNLNNNEIYFGKLSSIIQNSLLDDPRPYRQDVKLLQINLFSYIKRLKVNNLKIDVPYKNSERIKLSN